MAPWKLVLFISGSIAPADIPGLCEHARAVLARTAGVVACDVGGIATPDAAAVDALARIQLVALRQGRAISFRRVSRDLVELLELMAVRDVVLG